MSGITIKAPKRASADWAEVPVPPSVNNLFRSAGKFRVKTGKYKKWLALSLPLLAAIRPATKFPVAIVVRVRGKLNVQRDLDNLLKPIGDALVEAGVLPADDVRHVTAWVVSYVSDPGPALASVRVEEIATAPVR